MPDSSVEFLTKFYLTPIYRFFLPPSNKYQYHGYGQPSVKCEHISEVLVK